MLQRTVIIDALKSTELNQPINVKGWVRSKRGNKAISFIALNDGSTIKNIQIVVDHNTFPEEKLKQVTTGACISATGILVASQGSGQAVEIQITDLEVYGPADPEKYPLQKKGLSMEYLRTIAHLRPRTNTFGAVLRIRHTIWRWLFILIFTNMATSISIHLLSLQVTAKELAKCFK